MKLKMILLCTVLAVSFSLLSCVVTSRDVNIEISCEQFSENPHFMNSLKVNVGDKIRVKLCSNPTTGFKWDYRIIDETVLIKEDYDFEEPKDEGVVGAAGQEIWTFEAVNPGSTQVDLEYSQTWEGGQKAEWKFTLFLQVIQVE